MAYPGHPIYRASEVLMDKKWLLYAALILGGVIFADKIRALPVVGSKIPRM